MWNLSLLQIFISVANNASFTKAAKEVYRSQSAVSMQIKKLEEIVGAPLFERNGNDVTLSREGRTFLDYARRILSLVDEGLAAVRSKVAGDVIRIGCIEDYAGRLLPGMLARFWVDYPDVQIEVRAGETVQLLAGLGTQFDLVLASHPRGVSEGEKIGTDTLVLATSETNSPHLNEPIPVAFRAEALLEREWASAGLNATGRSWRCTYLASGIGTLETAVKAGLAIGVFKRATLPDGIRTLTVEEGFPTLSAMDITLHRPPNVPLGPSTARLAESLRRECQQLIQEN